MRIPDPVVSIMIPAFNAERYLFRCLESVSKQTWPQLDVVIVNDGSTDQSLSIAEEFARLDTRFRVFHQTNQGVSAARNFGIEQCEGSFLTFVDADDYIEPTMIEELLTKTHDCLLPLVFCNNDELWPHGIEERRLFEAVCDDSAITSDLVIRDIIRGSAGLVCGKLFKTEIVRRYGIRFDREIRMCEDQLFFIEVTRKCTDFLVVRKPLYHYDRRNAQSTTLAWLPNAFDMHLQAHRKIRNSLDATGLGSDLDFEILFRLKNIARYCIENEMCASSPFRRYARVRKIAEIIREPEVVEAFAKTPVDRTVDKVEIFLVVRGMPAVLALFYRVLSVRINMLRSLARGTM